MPDSSRVKLAKQVLASHRAKLSTAADKDQVRRQIRAAEKRLRSEQAVHTRARLEYLRGELRAERISWDEVAELQSLAEYIDPGDVELLEPAGVPEADARQALTNQQLYAELVAAAEAKLPPPEMGALIARVFNAEWETGDVYEALNEGGLSLPFGVIEALAQKFA